MDESSSPDQVVYVPMPGGAPPRYEEVVHRWILESLARWRQASGGSAEVVLPPPARSPSAAANRLALAHKAAEVLARGEGELTVLVPDVASPGLSSWADVASALRRPIAFAGWGWPAAEDLPGFLEAARRAALAAADAVAVGSRWGRELLRAEENFNPGLAPLGYPWDPEIARPHRQEAGSETVVCTRVPGAGDAFSTFRGVARSAGRRFPDVRWVYLLDNPQAAELVAGADSGPVEVVVRSDVDEYLEALALATVWWQGSSLLCPWDYGLVEAAALGLTVVAPDRPPWKELIDDVPLYEPSENAGGLEVLESVLHRAPGERPRLPEDLGHDPNLAGKLLAVVAERRAEEAARASGDRQEDGSTENLES